MELNFPDNYFEDEVRDGYYVDGMMKRCWASQLEVLKAVDDACKKMGIKWFADCGTLLGAVRHGGYIPWDDDLDICMLREDFDKFNQHAAEYLPEKYHLLFYDKANPREKVYDLLIRVINNEQLSKEPDFLEKYHDFPFISGLDIFPIDYLFKDEDMEETRRNLGLIVKEAAYADDAGDEQPSEDTLTMIAATEDALNIKITPTDRKTQLFGVLENVFRGALNDKGKYCALMPYWIGDHNHKYETRWFDEIVELPFECTTINVPAAYDAVLRVEYGDYIQINKSGGVHDYPYYRKQYSMLTTVEGKPLFTYYYDSKDLELPRPEPKDNLHDMAKDFTGLLYNVHTQILSSIESGNMGIALDLLAQAQDGAIKIGTMIEDSEGEGFVTVKHLEEYCEVIFRIHDILAQGGIPDFDIKAELDSALSPVSDSIEKDLPKKREVVFLPDSAKHWHYLESYWKEEKEKNGTSVYVIPIPLYDRALDGEAKVLRYDRNEYPDYVETTNFNDYDFAARKPDVIYIQNPHDEYHPTQMTHPFFFARNLRQYTPEMIYIPAFTIDEIGEEDERGKLSRDHFVKKPGVIIADMTIVSSEEIRQSYIEALCDLAGEDTKEIWETKIVVAQSPVSDKEDNDYQIPDKWKAKLYFPDGTKRKTILFHNTVATLLEYGDGMVEKLQSVLDTFKENKDDILLIWRSDINAKNVLRKKYPKVWGGYRDILEKYRKEDWGIFDDTPDYHIALSVCDAYYGDRDAVVTKARRRGIPVMIEDVNIR